MMAHQQRIGLSIVIMFSYSLYIIILTMMGWCCHRLVIGQWRQQGTIHNRPGPSTATTATVPTIWSKDFLRKAVDYSTCWLFPPRLGRLVTIWFFHLFQKMRRPSFEQFWAHTWMCWRNFIAQDDDDVHLTSWEKRPSFQKATTTKKTLLLSWMHWWPRLRSRNV